MRGCHFRRLKLALALLLLTGCPDPGGPPPVAIGQKYRFQLISPGAEQVLEVADVNAETVDYAVHAFVDGASVGEHPNRALTLSFSLLGDKVEGSTESLSLAGHVFTCRVTEDGDSRIFTAVQGGRPRFPGVVRITRGEQVVLELLEIE